MAKVKWKLAAGKTWKKKLEQDHPSHGKILPIPTRMQKRFGKGTMLIPKPLDVDAVMRKVRKGRLITQSQIRDALAKQSKADHACPLTTGIFVRIAAEAAEEDHQAGKKRITPYWRTIKDNGGLNEKFPGGAKTQAAKLRKEGFTIQPSKGKQPPKVKDFEKHLIK
ncbi:MAG: MGMT family protein [Phycisphaerales bacterium]|nr:MGMT family protein [Phycisphaerales bacterium]